MTLHVYTNGYDCIVAESPSEAHELFLTSYGERAEDYEDEIWMQCDDEQPLTIYDEIPGQKITVSCGAWCVNNGKGFLCSTEY